MDEKKSAAYLREKRIALDLTLSELAEKVGVGAYDVSCWEAGFFPEAKYLLPLSRALGVSVEEILKGEDEPPETFSAPRASGELPEARPAGKALLRRPLPDLRSSPLLRRRLLPDPLKRFPCPRPKKPAAKAEAETLSDQTPSTPSPPRRREEKSYYEKLHEKMKDIDFDVETYPSGQNGFSAWERKFGYILCSAFIVILLLIRISGLIGYINRDREVTTENYTEYVGVSVNSISSFNPQEYDLSVTAKKRITNFEMTVEVFFHNPFNGLYGKDSEDISKTVNFSIAVIESGETVTERITLEKIMFDRRFEVISVSGGLD
ncbi:MAG: helix-turn-helix domain-containing protein [Christensenellaceae bacterium]